jgi:DNA primase large subunit
MMDIIDFASIPCLSGAAEYLRSRDVDASTICLDRSSSNICYKANERVLEALQNGAMKYLLHNKPAAEKELLAYPVARIIVSCINNNYLTKRYALAVAKMSYEHIQRLDTKTLKELASDFGISITTDEKGKEVTIQIHFTDYLSHLHGLHDPKWKLLNRTVKGGSITISREDFSRIMEEEVRVRVEVGLPHEVPQDIREALKEYVSEVQGLMSARVNKQGFARDGFNEVVPTCFPPCINSAISDAQANINLSHTARFAMTSFLLNIGMTAEKIVDIFKASPDFKEQATKYQIDNIKGSSGEGYICPSCSTMSVNGNCPGKKQCKKVKNPLVYYRRMVWLMNKIKGKETQNGRDIK